MISPSGSLHLSRIQPDPSAFWVPWGPHPKNSKCCGLPQLPPSPAWQFLNLLGPILSVLSG